MVEALVGDHQPGRYGGGPGAIALARSPGRRYDRPHAREFQAYAGRLNNVADELEDTVLSVRMLPMDSLFSTFPRAVRDLARDSGKQVDLLVRGGETEIGQEDPGGALRSADPPVAQRGRPRHRAARGAVSPPASRPTADHRPGVPAGHPGGDRSQRRRRRDRPVGRCGAPLPEELPHRARRREADRRRER